MSDTPKVKPCPIYEAMSRKLLGCDSMPAIEKSKMMVRAIKAAKEAVAPRVIELERELAEARAEIERLKGVVISQVTPEPVVLSSYSTTAKPAKDERDMVVGIDHYAKLTNENAEMYAVLKICKGYFEEMELHEDSVTYKMICAALRAADGGE